MTQIGIVQEGPDEARVAATPATVQNLLRLGYQVAVEESAGTRSSYSDEEYRRAGATVVPRADAWGSAVVLKVNPPTEAEIGLLSAGTTLVGLLSPALRPDLVEALAARGVTALALDAVPRISRAQSMDVL